MNRALPPLAIVLGLVGLLPIIGFGLAAISGTEPHSGQMLLALIGYGAVVLSFLGGVHWGFALTEDPPRAQRARLVLGALPALVGWVAVLVTLVLPREVGLAVLIAGFIGAVVIEARARQQTLIPRGYMVLRWGLSIVTVALLTTVLVLRLVGARIVF